MAIAEDPASVLEQFVHDVANLPAEIAHLLEEIQAKDRLIQECRNTIDSRDGSIQRYVKTQGSLEKHPKEEAYGKIVQQHYDKAQTLQEDKVALAEKAFALLDRHVKRLDVKIRDLQNEGAMPIDPQLPSLLRDSPGNKIPPNSLVSTGVNTPLHPLSGNAPGGAPNIANAAMVRMANAAAGRVNSPGAAAMQAVTVSNPSHAANAPAVAAMAISGRQRDASVGSDTKRRRLNTSVGPLPLATSALARQSSLGPGTPKPGTPGSRAGSAGPRPVKKATKKVSLHPQMRKKVGKGGIPKKSARRIFGTNKASPSTTGEDDSAGSDAEGSDEENQSGGEAHGGGGGGAEEDGMEVDEEEGDDTKYCTCQRVSFGDMVGCDNEECPYQWFHWECIGLREEPQGEWLCPTCRELKPSQIVRAK